ncbi:YwqJ-related putative deaminase [Priestia flexa]|uniref:YwqJ-related putative deaminase n=1 Tax=Priestia flexa TaxID=86664 RepID=UPI00240E6497|nr:YwqJ-related putative deaminase [Priestia flexa]WEZ07864.1 YwqJ-related putative deaminase [Priestia flexa]
MVQHPVETAESIDEGVKAVWDDPKGVAKTIGNEMKDSWNEQVINGDAKSRGHYFSYLTANVAMSIVGTKGADKLAKATKLEQLSGAATKKLNEGAAAINVRTQSALQNLGLNGLDNRLAYPGVGSVKGNGGYQFIERVDGGNGVGTKVRDEKVAEVTGKSRIEYLRNRYGKFTSEELNYRINLRSETLIELQKLKETGISKKKLGPAFAGVYDKTTGEIYYAINEYDGILPDFHPLIKSRYDLMPKEVIESYEFTKGADTHAEVIALNKALKENPQADLDNFVINVIRTGQNRTKPAGMMFPRCPHCAYLTDEFEIITEVSKNVK